MMIRWLGPKTLRKKRVLVRVDFNVPIEKGRILDDFRIRAHLPTLRMLLKNKNTIIILAHLGKPDGKKVPSLSLKPAAARLARLLGKNVKLVSDPFSKSAVKKIESAESGSVFLVENIRFWKGEEKTDERFAGSLARLGEVFVQDAFGVIHRPHASVVELPRLMPSYGGLLLKKEIEALKPLVNRPLRPFVVIMGGAKISTKLHLLRAFVRRADRVLIGGALANTVLAALGFPVGKSLLEKNILPMVRKIALRDRKILFPHDVIAARSPRAAKFSAKSIGDIAKDDMILDIGNDARRMFIKELKRAKTIFWNGPLGLVEKKEYALGTLAVARSLRGIRAYKVIGGGDLVAFFEKHRLAKSVSHFATGGGSSLMFIAGFSLPGMRAMEKSK
ncbi:MAG: phosphoglycerate kinase [Candidatus Sungiibacteriota bacterium]